MNPDIDLLFSEKEEKNGLIDESKIKYEEGVEETKQLYYLNKYIVAALRKKSISNAAAKRYADRNASLILKRAKERVNAN